MGKSWLLLYAGMLAACAMTPTLAAGAGVRLLVKSEPGTDCRELGDVSTGNDWYRDESHVKIVLRNQAAEMGGNVATLDVLKNDGKLIGGSGRAFACE